MAQTPAEYRVLGANEPYLASLREASGGHVVLTATDPWRHDLTATSQFTELWPWLLLLALLLWPLDVALRRMSLGRRELVAAREWVRGIGRRRRVTAPRTAAGDSLLATRGRAGGEAARAALVARFPERPVESERPAEASAPPPEPPAPTEAGADTLARLREAKRRSRDR